MTVAGAGYPTLDTLDVTGKVVLVRMDLNVPMQGGRVTDATRILRQVPTLEYLLAKKARVAVISHFGRPGGRYDPAMSLAPLVDALGEALGGQDVHFGVDCIGLEAKHAVDALRPGEIVLLENLRFHSGEEENEPLFADALASLADVYVNDAFSCSHREHASVVGVTRSLPFAAGRLMQQELETLEGIFATPERPIAAVVGGAKVSTKIGLLKNLVQKMDYLLIGGAMANTFLAANGHDVGKSLYEPNHRATAQDILQAAKEAGCEIVLPVDVVTANAFEAHAPTQVVPVEAIAADGMALDIGPETAMCMHRILKECKTVVWNGPMGAFEVSPFDAGTVGLARACALLTRQGMLKSIAGGGDTIAALSHAGLFEGFSYLSTAGGAFLEWLEGQTLPGVASLMKAA